jgi:hypothetical protein
VRMFLQYQNRPRAPRPQVGARPSLAHAEGGYRIFRFGGRPIVALPAGSIRFRLVALTRYFPFTPRRSLLYALMRLAVLTRLDSLFCAWQASPLPAEGDFGFGEWLATLRNQLGERDLRATVLWPSEHLRRRTYVHLLRPSGEPVAFCKIARIGRDDGLHQESVALLAMQAAGGMRSARVPRLLGEGLFSDHRYCVYEPLPVGVIPHRGEPSTVMPVVAELSARSRLIGREKLGGIVWWQRFAERRTGLPESFLRQVDTMVDHGIEVCRVQGDLVPANIFRAAGVLWICDWEYSADLAPISTDEISFRVGRNYHRCLAKPEKVVAELIAACSANGRRHPAGDVAAALAFLCAWDIRAARVLAARWRFIDEGERVANRSKRPPKHRLVRSEPRREGGSEMTLDPEIWHAAAMLVENHGAHAAIAAAQRADEMRKEGDGKGEAVWKEILEAVLDSVD